ncbi:MAG: MFS transporter [Actinobacteria bacterium]|nr:MFS transporter [Actinomycetota bacterium]
MPGVRRLLLARLISNLGNGMAPVALAFAVLESKDGSASKLGILLSVQAISMVLFLPLGGIWADRHRRPTIIATTDFILGLDLLVTAYLFWSEQTGMPLLMALCILAGLLNAFWSPAFPGLVPLVVEEKHLQQMNGFVSIASNIGYISGAAVAGLLVSAFGGAAGIAGDALSFLIAAALVWKLRHRHQVAEPSGGGMFHELKSGWKVFLSFRWVVVAVAGFSVVMMVMRGAEGVLGPVLMKEHFGGAKAWAFVATVESIGFVLGSTINTRYKPKHPLYVCTLLSFTAAFYVLVLRPSTPLIVIAGAALLWGITIESWYIHWMTALQLHIPRESLSRVSSYDMTFSLIFQPIGLAIAGPAIAGLGIAQTSLIGASVITVAIIVILFEPTIRTLSNAHPPGVEQAGPDS